MRKIFCVLLTAAVLLIGCALPGGAVAEPDAPRVAEINIDIRAEDYKLLTSSQEKQKLDVSVCRDQAASVPAQINIRGSSSKEIGLLTKAKRIPFELKFDDADAFGARIGNKSVKFINSFTVYRLIAEYMALELYEAAGVPTPAHEIVFVRFNGVDFGLYLAVEDVNSAFLRKWYGEELGSSYKATNKHDKDKQYIDSDWFGRIYEKAENGSQILPPLLDALDRGEGYEAYINLDQWLRYFACVAAIGGDGSIFTEKNNFVLYDNGGRFELIPWDQSEAFSGRETPNGIDRYFVGDDEEEPSPLFDLIMRDPEKRETYHAYIREICETILAPERWEPRYLAVVDAIEPYLPLDHSIGLNERDAIDRLRSEERNGFFNLRYAFRCAYENLLAQLDGREETFFVNDSFADLYLFESFEALVAGWEANSPMYDAKLPRRILSAAGGKTAMQGRTVLICAVCCVAAAAVLTCVFAARKKRKSKTETELMRP